MEYLDSEENLILLYYNYLRINKGITFEQFLEEKPEIVNTLILIKQEELKKQEKEYKKSIK